MNAKKAENIALLSIFGTAALAPLLMLTPAFDRAANFVSDVVHDVAQVMAHHINPYHPPDSSDPAMKP